MSCWCANFLSFPKSTATWPSEHLSARSQYCGRLGSDLYVWQAMILIGNAEAQGRIGWGTAAQRFAGEFVAGINRIQYNQGNGINAMAGRLFRALLLPIRDNLQTFMAWGPVVHIGWSRLRHASVGAGIAGMAPMPWQVYG